MFCPIFLNNTDWFIQQIPINYLLYIRQTKLMCIFFHFLSESHWSACKHSGNRKAGGIISRVKQGRRKPQSRTDVQLHRHDAHAWGSCSHSAAFPSNSLRKSQTWRQQKGAAGRAQDNSNTHMRRTHQTLYLFPLHTEASSNKASVRLKTQLFFFFLNHLPWKHQNPFMFHNKAFFIWAQGGRRRAFFLHFTIKWGPTVDTLHTYKELKNRVFFKFLRNGKSTKG